MKIIEALKQIKFLTVKVGDIQTKIMTHSADMEFDTPPFPDMRGKISEWLQASGDLVKEIARLKFRVQKTNVLTPLTIELHGTQVTKSIYEWIQRRKDLAKLELTGWERLTDKNLVDRQFQQTTGTLSMIKMRRYYDPQEKEKKIAQLKIEPVLVDAALEITNCTVDLLD